MEFIRNVLDFLTSDLGTSTDSELQNHRIKAVESNIHLVISGKEARLMAGTFCVTITHCRTDGDKATLGFVVANAALGSEKDTMIFLSSDGVWCAVKGEAEKINEGAPFAPLKDLIDKFVAGGGKILVCTPCMKKRNIAEDQLIKGATPAGGAALVEWLANGSPSVAY
jgi:uncharacterized protein